MLHSLEEAMITGRYAFVLLVLFAGVWGVPWRRPSRSGVRTKAARGDKRAAEAGPA